MRACCEYLDRIRRQERVSRRHSVDAQEVQNRSFTPMRYPRTLLMRTSFSREEPELVIRTGENRLTDFLIWQAVYPNYTSPKLIGRILEEWICSGPSGTIRKDNDGTGCDCARAYLSRTSDFVGSTVTSTRTASSCVNRQLTALQH